MRNFLVLFVLLIATVAARRNTGTPQPPAKDVKPWGVNPTAVVARNEKEIKPVKRAGTKSTPPKNGWFGVSSEKHPYWEQVEEVMDGFE